MPVKVRCPGCAKVLNAPDKARGKAIRCPACETKIRVPEGGGSPLKKSQAAKAGADSAHAIATLDLSKLEDTSAKLCPKCGADLEEDATECPACGIDLSTGAVGETALKKQMTGPDPDLFYKDLWGSSWRFVIDNKTLAIRPTIFTLICSLLFAGCIFMAVFVTSMPPKVFWIFLSTIALLVPLGSYWFLWTEVIRATLGRKDKLKRINFDFFLNAALGVKVLAWTIAFAGPYMAIPVLVAVMLARQGAVPIAAAIVGVAALPLVAVLPIVMSHMSMPITYRGWILPYVFKLWIRMLKPTLVWMLFFLVTNLPVFAGIGAAAAVYGDDMQTMFATMQANTLARAATDASNAELSGPLAQPQSARTAPVNWTAPIVPGVVWAVVVVIFGFTGLFNMRTNGQFTYYFKRRLNLIAREKEYKYVAKEDPKMVVRGKHPAAVGSRFVALIIDGVVIGILQVVAGVVMGAAAGSAGMDPQTMMIASGATGFLIMFLYFAAQEGTPQGMTLGKKAMGVYVCDSSGKPFGFGKAAVRTLAKLLLSGPFLLLGYIMAFFNPEHRTLHDNIAGTLVRKK